MPVNEATNANGANTDVLSPLASERIEYDAGAGGPRVRGYDIVGALGSGGMGLVYKARHRELHRTVAIKTLRWSAMSDPEFRDRFRIEAEAVARLQHPNIIQVFEIGTIEPLPGEVHPSPFIALEFVDGGSLADRTRTPQPPQSAARMVEKLARAVHAAHRLGVIHRDLKPANVLLTQDGEPKIADFGLAKQLDAEKDAAGRFVTQFGTIVGTPEYMAPEQAAGKVATPAIDIYALGVILYELLTARVPFRGATPTETLHLVQLQEPVTPRRLQPKLPRDLQTICLKCLEKSPAKRYPTAEALADDLACWLDGRPIKARPVGPLGRAARWAKRNPAVAVLSTAVVLVAVAGLAGVVWKWREAVAHAAAADRATTAARDHARAERREAYRANIAAAASSLQAFNVSGARQRLEAAPDEYRKWEWQHFRSRLDLARHVLPVFTVPAAAAEISADGRRVVLVAGTAVRVWDTATLREVMAFESPTPIEQVHVSPDGRTLAYRSGDGREVTLRDVDTNTVRAVLAGHEHVVHDVRFTPRSDRLVTGSLDQGHHVWDVHTGALLRRITPESNQPQYVDFSADGKRMLLSSSATGTARIVDVESGRELVALAGHQHPSFRATFDERGDRVVTVEPYPKNTVRLWDAATGRRICEVRGHTNAVVQVALSPDGSRLATAARDQTVGLWDAATGRAIAVLRGHRGSLSSVAFSPDGTRLVSASEDHTVRLWDTATGEPLAVLYGHTGGVLAAAYLDDGRAIVSVSRDGTARVWDARAAETDGLLRGHTTFAYDVAFHPDGRRLASASWDGTVRVWDADSGRQTRLLNHGERAIVTSVAFHPAGKLLASRARDGVRLWDLASGQEVHRWPAPDKGWHDARLAFNRSGDRLACCCEGRLIRIWDVDSHAEVAVLRGHQDEVRDVAFSPDGRWLASIADRGDPRVRVWNVARGEEVRALEGHAAGGYSLTFNRAGTLLASSATDGTVRLWDTSTWATVAKLPNGSNVYGVSFTPDGTRLACGCADNSIRLWDVETSQEVAELRGHSEYVHAVAFSPDGKRLASASGDSTVRVWDTVRPQDR